MTALPVLHPEVGEQLNWLTAPQCGCASRGVITFLRHGDRAGVYIVDTCCGQQQVEAGQTQFRPPTSGILAREEPMTVTIDISEVRAAIDTDNLKLDLPDDPELQKKVNEHFPAVFDIWAESAAVDPYETFSIDGVADEDGPCVPPGVTVSRERGSDIRSACCHTIREAVRAVNGQDPSSGSNTLAKG